MSADDREKHKAVFINNHEYKILLGTIDALGVNHTLTVANNVIMYDLPWQNASRIQAEDRLVRIGQTKPVNVYTLLTKDTVDETVYKILTEKQAISDFMVDDSLDLKKHPEIFDLLIGK
jgi:SNF2 family DNA or RNA helicase